MKNGLVRENEKIVYYENDKPVHAGVIQIDDDLYYIGAGGIAATETHAVHTSMTNGLLRHGYYTFGHDGKLIKDSYVPFEKTGNKRKRRRRKHLSKKEKRLITIISLLLVVCIVFAELAIYEAMINNQDDDAFISGNDICLPSFSEEILLCSTGALNCYNGTTSVLLASAYGDPYKPMAFEYNLRGLDGLLRYSENPDFSDFTEMILDGDKRIAYIDNLKTGARYYYEVVVDGKTYSGTFKTAQSTRFLKVDGLSNVRDVGGYVNKDGKIVKQGMIIRGPECDGLIESDYSLSAESIRAMMDTFGFVYDMDLRADYLFPNDFESCFGEEVNHSFYNAQAYDAIFDPLYMGSLKRVFSDMANEENYPMYLHCTYGADRTGTVVFLLQAILNLSEEQMIREYQMSGFYSSKFATSTQYEAIIAGVESKNGDSLQEKIVNFLVDDVGVDVEDIELIRNILLD